MMCEAKVTNNTLRSLLTTIGGMNSSYPSGMPVVYNNESVTCQNVTLDKKRDTE